MIGKSKGDVVEYIGKGFEGYDPSDPFMIFLEYNNDFEHICLYKGKKLALNVCDIVFPRKISESNKKLVKIEMTSNFNPKFPNHKTKLYKHVSKSSVKRK